ncbi:hypothetical protein ABPG74_021505 [Tetrahymena malaccensis]
MFQTPKMKLFNFEQFQFMLNQIQITQLSESTSPSSKNNIKQNPYQILNQIIDRKQTNLNLAFNSYNSQKQLQQCSISCQQNYPSPKNQQHIFSNTTQNIGSKVNGLSLKQSNSNKSIGAYSSRSNQQEKQQLQQQNVEQRKNIKISISNRNSDLVGTVLNTAPCYSTVEECSDDVRDLNLSYEAADETMQMKELSCSIQDDQIDENIQLQQQFNNYNFNLKNCNNEEISSSLDKKINSKNQFNRIEDDKNNPTIISRSNSQNQLDPLLQNLNVKKMCEVQKHYCKKRIREFRQPCEDIVQYQEFIKMINQRCSKENTTHLSSNRRIKTEHSQNSLKQKPPTGQYQNQYNQSQNSINSQQNILSSNNTQPQQNFISQTCQNQYQPQLQGCQYQIAQDQIANSNILKPKQINNQILNTQNETTYSELNSKIFKFKKKNQPSLQENILAHQMQQQSQQQHFSQFNSNKENSMCDITSQKSGIKINNNNNQTQKASQNISLNNQISVLIGSRENSISNYDSRNSRSYAANSKNQQKQVQQNTICPAIKQAQQHQLKNLSQKSQSPFYSKGSQQEREQKNIVFREQRTNSSVSYNSKNNTSFNGQQTSKSSNSNNIPLKQQNPLPQFNIQNPLISQRSRISTMEGYERNQCDNPQTHNNQKLTNLSIYRQNNISKSSDTTSTNHYYQNLITNQTNFGGLAQNYNSNKNAVPFNQSYYKRQQQQQQQQQIKFTKNLKQLNFNCLNYIRKYKEIIELQIIPFIQKIPHDDILEHQNAYKQSLLIMSDQVDISSQEDLQNFQDFLSLRSKSIFNQFLSKYGIMLQI